MACLWPPSLPRRWRCTFRVGYSRMGPIRLLSVGPRRPPVLTLNPDKFEERGQEPINLSGFTKASCNAPCNVQLRQTDAPTTTFYLAYRKTHKTPFPANTTGFLYYHSPPDRPRISGEVRFRIAEDNRRQAFEAGRDLMLPSGQTWCRPLYCLKKVDSYRPLYEKLLEDGLVGQDLDTALQNLPFQRIMYSRCHLLYELEDPFPLDLTVNWRAVLALTEQGMESGIFLKIFRDHRRKMLVTPYTGTLLLQFERSTLPEHAGTRTVVVRVMKELEPVKCVLPDYDDYIPKPKEGELVQQLHFGKPRPWSVDVDDDKSRLMTPLLRRLWLAGPIFPR